MIFSRAKRSRFDKNRASGTTILDFFQHLRHGSHHHSLLSVLLYRINSA